MVKSEQEERMVWDWLSFVLGLVAGGSLGVVVVAALILASENRRK